MFIVATSVADVQPAMVLELLQRVEALVRDYLGVFTEEVVRKNFALVAELLDEAVDYGYPQATNAEEISKCVRSDVVGAESRVKEPPIPLGQANLNQRGKKAPAKASQKPAVGPSSKGQRAEEVFVDVVENVSAVFSAGCLRRAKVSGSLIMRSFLSGAPKLTVALNEDLAIGAGINKGQGSNVPDAGERYSGVTLDGCLFHSEASLDALDREKAISLKPPKGEARVMAYTCSRPSRLPFRLKSSVQESAMSRLEVVLRLRATFPSNCTTSHCRCELPLPRIASHATCRLPRGQSEQQAQFDPATNKVTWNVGKIEGNSEHTLHVFISLAEEYPSLARSELGPCILKFGIPMLSSSRLAVRYMHIAGWQPHDPQAPARWVRYVTESDSYTFRI